MKKTYYQHSFFCDSKDWVESDIETFNDEVIEHRKLYVQRYKFEQNKTTYFFDNVIDSSYDWKVVVEIEG